MSLPVIITFKEAVENASVFDEVGGGFLSDQFGESIYERTVQLNEKFKVIADQELSGESLISIKADRKIVKDGKEEIVESEYFYNFDASVSAIDYPK